MMLQHSIKTEQENIEKMIVVEKTIMIGYKRFWAQKMFYLHEILREELERCLMFMPKANFKVSYKFNC